MSDKSVSFLHIFEIFSIFDVFRNGRSEIDHLSGAYFVKIRVTIHKLRLHQRGEKMPNKSVSFSYILEIFSIFDVFRGRRSEIDQIVCVLWDCPLNNFLKLQNLSVSERLY